MKRKFLFNLDADLLDRAKKNYMGGRMEYANNTAFIQTLLMVAAAHYKGVKNERAR